MNCPLPPPRLLSTENNLPVSENFSAHNLTCWEKIQFKNIGGKGKKIYVKNLNPPRCCIKETTENNNHFEICPKGLKFIRFLKCFFSQCGVVADIFVFFESQTHCACIVVYASYTAATRSLKELNGVPLNGRSILVAKPKQHYFSNLYVHKQERQIINLANVVFGFNHWSSEIIETKLEKVEVVKRRTTEGGTYENENVLYVAACTTTIQVNIALSPTILNNLSVLGTITYEATSDKKLEAVKQSRIESKTRALIIAFEKIQVAVSSKFIIPMIIKT